MNQRADWTLDHQNSAHHHLYPNDDLIEHDVDGGDCICGPTTEAVFRDDGSNWWLTAHHSLDGREHREPDHDRDACPLCSTTHTS